MPDPTENETILNPDLAQIYRDNNVEDIEQHLISCIRQGFRQQERHIRLNPRFLADESLKQLSDELGGAVPKAIEFPLLKGWGFYSIPGSFSLQSSKVYAEGRVYGMDLSSGAAVAALELFNEDDLASTKDQSKRPEDENKYHLPLQVLDLCCCPGLKLCAIADALDFENGDKSNTSLLVGVDICSTRLQVCKKILRKYHFDQNTSGRNGLTSSTRIRLYCTDGTTFNNEGFEDERELIFDSIAETQELEGNKDGKRKRMNKSARARERKRLKFLETTVSNHGKVDTVLFDRVLVDAECSTDGSTKHLLEKIKKEKTIDSTPVNGLSTKLIVENKGCLEKLHQLQRRLILQGFRNLKVNGLMVYSTCSLSKLQNEEIVEHLLKVHPNAYTKPFTKHDIEGFEDLATISARGSLRFNPTSNCGGFFLAKIGKHELKK